MRLSRAQEIEYRRRRNDRPERPPLMQSFFEEVERRKLTETVQRLQKGLQYDRYKYTLLWSICSVQVREKLCNLRLVNNSFACKVEDFIVKLYQLGKIQYLDLDTFRKIVEKFLAEEYPVIE